METSSEVKYQRREKKSIPDNAKDEKYYERRKRNNEAAKKSRDARRIHEDFIKLRVKILENENGILQRKITLLHREIELLHAFILDMQRQITDIFNCNVNSPISNNLNKITSTYHHDSQLCFMRNFDGIISSHAKIMESTSNIINNNNNTSNTVMTINTLISQLSSIIQRQ